MLVFTLGLISVVWTKIVSSKIYNVCSSYSSHCFFSFAILFSRASFFCCNLCEYITVSAAIFLWSSLFSVVSSSPAAGLMGLLFSLKDNNRPSPPSSTSLSICKDSSSITTISITLLACYYEWCPLIGYITPIYSISDSEQWALDKKVQKTEGRFSAFSKCMGRGFR